MKKLVWGTAVAAALMTVIPALAGTISVGWDAVPDADLAGYRIYYGTASGNYDQQLDVGLVTEATLDVDDCRSYFVAVKARDAAGNVSIGFSSELTGYARPRLGLITPASAEQGSEADLLLTGANFRAGATVRFGSPGITVSSVTVQSCTMIGAHVRMDPGAPLGLTSVEVVNPDDTFGAGGGLFSVLPSGSALTVISTNPPGTATDVPVRVHPQVTFTRAILAASVAPWSVRLLDESGSAVGQAPGSPALGPDGKSIVIIPVGNLAFESDYRIFVVGGPTGILDETGQSLSSSFLEDPPFTTEADPAAALTISTVRVTPQATAANISWTTSTPAGGQVFYRKVSDVSYRSSSLETGQITRHWVQLANLEPSTDYAFYVESRDAQGNTASSMPETNFTTDSYVYLSLEAESGQLTLPIRERFGAEAFRGAWIDTPPGAPLGTADHPSGKATLDFFIPGDGTWHVWMRLFGLDDTTDSWFVSMDGAPPHEVGPSTTPGWSWTEDGTYQLARGEHEIALGGREQETRADQLVITNDPDFVPDSRPGSNVEPPAPPRNLSATVLDDSVELSWSNPVSDVVRIVATYRTDGVFPLNPSDGMQVGTAYAVLRARGSMQHTSLPEARTCWYSLFAIDGAGNASEPAQIRVAR